MSSHTKVDERENEAKEREKKKNREIKFSTKSSNILLK